MRNIIFIAPPAAGKGTISKYLVDNYDYNHISTGELLRKKSKENNELGRTISSLINNGTFVSDELVLEIIKQELSKRNTQPFILDGIPRNLKQVEYLERLFQEIDVNNYLVINIDIEKETLKKRAVGRRICNNCRRNYNIYFDQFKPLNEGICDSCQNKLLIRDDDTEEVFDNRYETYLNNTRPVIDFYKDKKILKVIDGNKSEKEIINSIENILKGAKND